MTLNSKLLSLIVFSIILLSLISCEDTETTKQEELVIQTNEYQLIWSDEFDYEGLPDSTKWTYDVGDACDLPCGCGWGNNELQYYTKGRLENSRVKNGQLTIELRKEEMKNRAYTSARLVTKNKGDWKYGRFEVRARIERSLGTWAAIWMLPTDNEYGTWPYSGEIDIMENVGWAPDTILVTAHTGAYNPMIGTQQSSSLTVTDIHTAFHDYILEWDEQEYNVYVDNDLVFNFKNEDNDHMTWPFDKNFHLILNMAFGGNLGGKEGLSPEKLPCKMEIDYVRVYSKNNLVMGMKN